MNRSISSILAAAAIALAACGAPPAAPVSSAPAAAQASVRILPAEVSVADAKALRDAGAFMLDVREPEEWSAVHMPGATLVPLGALESRLSEIPKDRQIVVVCRSGNRSAAGRDMLKKAGFTNVTSMSGGMNVWQASGYPVTSGR